MVIGGNFSPIRAVIKWIGVIVWGRQSDEQLFQANVRTELAVPMGIIASRNKINLDIIGPRSWRGGGANAMFVAGYDTDVIKRWGRWKSSAFAKYLRNVDRVLEAVGVGMMLATVLLPQIPRKSTDDGNRIDFTNNGRAGGKGFRSGNSDHSQLRQISGKLSQFFRHPSMQLSR